MEEKQKRIFRMKILGVENMGVRTEEHDKRGLCTPRKESQQKRMRMREKWKKIERLRQTIRGNFVLTIQKVRKNISVNKLIQDSGTNTNNTAKTIKLFAGIEKIEQLAIKGKNIRRMK